MSLHIGDIGTEIILTIAEDGAIVNISGVATKFIILRKPSEAVVTKTAEFVTDGTDGQIKYVTISADDLDEDGIWHAQGHVTGLGGWSGKSDIAYFRVKSNL